MSLNIEVRFTTANGINRNKKTWRNSLKQAHTQCVLGYVGEGVGLTTLATLGYNWQLLATRQFSTGSTGDAGTTGPTAGNSATHWG